MTWLDKTTENVDELSKRFCENLNDAVCSGNRKALQLFTETCIGLLEYYTPRVIHEHLIGLPFDIDFYVDWKNVSDDMNLLDTVDRKVAVVIHYDGFGGSGAFCVTPLEEGKVKRPTASIFDRVNAANARDVASGRCTNILIAIIPVRNDNVTHDQHINGSQAASMKDVFRGLADKIVKHSNA